MDGDAIDIVLKSKGTQEELETEGMADQARVVLLCRIDGNFGGVEQTLLSIARRLDRCRYHPVIVPIANRGELLRLAEEEGIDHEWLPMANRWSIIRAGRGLAEIAERRGAVLLHTFGIRSNTLAFIARRRRSIRWVIRLPNLNWTDYASPVRGWISHRFNNGLIRQADAVQVISPPLRDFVLGWRRPPSRVFLVPNGVDLERVPGPAERECVFEQYPALRGRMVIGGVGRLESIKGFDLLLRAFVHVREKYPNALLMLVGEGSKRQALVALASELGLHDQVLFTGYTPFPMRILGIMSVYVSSSRSEGVPNSLLEAMACGTPVIATRVGGVESVLRHGVEGILIEPNCVEALADAMIHLLADRTESLRLAAAARRRVEREFSVETMVSRVQEMYDQVLAVESREA